MIGPISCRCSSEGHSLASYWFCRQIHSPFFCERKGFGEARPSPLQTRSSNLDDQKLGFHSCGLGLQSCGLGFHSCKFAGPQRFSVIKAVKSGLGRVSVWETQRLDILENSLCRLNTRKIFLCKGQMMAGGGGKNAAMEASHGPNSFNADQIDTAPNSKDAANATSLPGFICPSVTTVGKSTNITWQECMVKKEERQKLLGQKGCVIWITGLSGSGKSTLACTLDHTLLKRGNLSYVLDGDNVRHGLNNNLGFCVEDRAENIRRVGEVAKLFVDAGVICIASVISPYRKDRDACRQLLQAGEFIEVHMNFPLTLCEERDPKGLYKLARAGKIKGFTGVDDPYEAPLNCEAVMEPIEGRCPTPAEMAARLVSYLEEKCFLGPPR